MHHFTGNVVTALGNITLPLSKADKKTFGENEKVAEIFSNVVTNGVSRTIASMRNNRNALVDTLQDFKRHLTDSIDDSAKTIATGILKSSEISRAASKEI